MIKIRVSNNRIVAAIAAVSLVASACASGPDEATADTAMPEEVTPDASARRPVIVDYSPTLSDVPAMMYIASHPDVDLVAVTLAGTGESDCGPGVRNTLALLAIVGQSDVPVACGREAPLVGDRDWPEPWRESANNIVGVVLPSVTVPSPPRGAIDVLGDVLEQADEPVVIVTLGPLTNIGALVSERPDLVERIARVVTMGGAVDVGGNVDTAPTAEWNLYIDPESVRLVIGSGVPTLLVPLDATASVPGGRQIPIQLERASDLEPGGEAVRQLFAANLGAITSPGWFFWDELAAVAAIDESVVTIEEMTISVDDAGATLADPDGAPIRVAVAADPAAFAQSFVDVLSGGRAITPAALSPAEADYIDAVSTHGATLEASMERAFITLAGFDDDNDSLTVGDLGDTPAVAVDGLFEAMEVFVASLSQLDPPALFAASHEQVIASFTAAVATRADGVAAIRAALADDPDAPAGEFFSNLETALDPFGTLQSLGEAASACTDIEIEAELRGTIVATGCAEIAS